MAWVWPSSGSWWWTGKPGVLQSMGSQRVRLNWATELTWSMLNSVPKPELRRNKAQWRWWHMHRFLENSVSIPRLPETQKELQTGSRGIVLIQSSNLEKAIAPHSSTLSWKIPWPEEPGRLQSVGLLRVRHDWATSLSRIWERNAADSSVLAWRMLWTGEPSGLPSVGSHRVGHDWSHLAAAAVVF